MLEILPFLTFGLYLILLSPLRSNDKDVDVAVVGVVVAVVAIKDFDHVGRLQSYDRVGIGRLYH